MKTSHYSKIVVSAKQHKLADLDRRVLNMNIRFVAQLSAFYTFHKN